MPNGTPPSERTLPGTDQSASGRNNAVNHSVAISRPSFFRFILLLLVSGLCLGVMVLGFTSLYLSERTAISFGPPAAGLSWLEQSYLSAQLLLQADDLLTPLDPSGEPQPFLVQLGESTESLILRMHEAGLIRNPGGFRAYLQYAGLDKSLQAGQYSLSPAMSAVEIAHTLQDATPSVVAFTILPGWRLEEIAATLPTSGLSIDPNTFILAASEPVGGYSFSGALPEDATLEGFLYPDMYRLPRYMNAARLVRTFLDNFAANLTPVLLQGFEAQGLTVFEAVILASIVEREAIIDEEMPLIASVFLNRLAAGMKLDSDPTVQYALGYNDRQKTWWTNPLSLEDLQIDSPYNTYQYPGLPPGPIANPGPASLRAVAFPAQSKYFYFRSACDNSGTHVFAETYSEHIANACP